VAIGSFLWATLALLMLILVLMSSFGGRSGLLISAHVFTLTMGYCASFVIGGFGLCYASWQSSGTLSAAREQSLNRGIFWFGRLGLVLSITGLLSGMLWSEQTDGSYGMSDLHTIGAICVSLWFMALWLAERLGTSNDRMRLSILGDIIVALAWFGVGILTHPTAHQFSSQWPLTLFLGTHIVILVMSFSRRFEPNRT
jgi:hypothetical protein